MNLDRLEQSVRDMLFQYLTGKSTLRSFMERFIPATWDVESDTTLHGLVSEIKLRVAEYTSGHRTEKELKRLLGVVASMFEIRVAASEDIHFLSSSREITLPTSFASFASVQADLTADSQPLRIPLREVSASSTRRRVTLRTNASLVRLPSQELAHAS